MKKLFSTIFATLLSLSLILTGFTFTAQADDLISADDTVINKNARFADDSILVLLTREASLKFKAYTVDDFAEIGCKTVSDLSTSAGAKTQKALNEAVVAFSSNEEPIFSGLSERHREIVSNYKQILCLKLNEPSKENVLAAIERLKERADVLTAEPDYILTFDGTSTQTQENNSSSATRDIGAQNAWAYDLIQMDDAYGLLTEVSSVYVGVIDSGIDGDHPLLQSTIEVSLCRDFSSGSAVATGTPTDPVGHGTQVAGIIAAQLGGTSPVYSICPMARLVSLKICDTRNEPIASAAISAINYADQVGIDVLNASFGFDTLDTQPSILFQQAILGYDGVYVCSAGNELKNIDTYHRWPACYTCTNMIVVGASNQSDQRWSEGTAGSNCGLLSVDVFAPGVSMHTTADGGLVTSANGTSFAAPVVTGVVAVILAQFPNADASDVRNAIINYATTVTGLEGLCVSGGRINAYRALRSLFD